MTLDVCQLCDGDGYLDCLTDDGSTVPCPNCGATGRAPRSDDEASEGEHSEEDAR